MCWVRENFDCTLNGGKKFKTYSIYHVIFHLLREVHYMNLYGVFVSAPGEEKDSIRSAETGTNAATSIVMPPSCIHIVCAILVLFQIFK